MSRRVLAIAAVWAASFAVGCGDDGNSSEERIERVEQRYEKLWNADSVRCREAPGGEGYECRIVTKEGTPGAAP